MKVFILTDMEGVAGIDQYDQCYDARAESAPYQYGREQLTADVNAAVAGAFDAGATEVRVLDGHGPNGNKGFLEGKIDPRITRTWIASRNPLRWEGIDADLTAVALVGQHAMAGTINGFLDHTQSSRTVCRFMIDGAEHGEMSQLAMYAGGRGVPLVYASGDEALCDEARRLFPHVGTTPTKRGTGWRTCELYPVDEVRRNIRRDFAAALRRADRARAWKARAPIEVTLEYNCSEHADYSASFPNVQRPHARVVRWWIDDPLDIYTWPNAGWHPPVKPPVERG